MCVMDGLKITKSNAIINSSYRLSLNELRIVLFGLSQINPMSEEFPLFHRIHIKELAIFYNIGEKHVRSFYEDIKSALITRFWEREFSYFDENRKAVVKRRWLIEVEYGRKDGSLAYHYNPMIKDQLQQLAKRFTSYFLTNVANMKSAYAIRLYEIAIMYLNASGKNKVTFNKQIEEIKKHLGIGDKYKHFYHMKTRVLEKAKQEINKHSDIRFDYEIVKFGRHPESIAFHVRRKKEQPRTHQIKKLTLEAPEKTFASELADTRASVVHWEKQLSRCPSKDIEEILKKEKEKLKTLEQLA